MKIPQRIVGLLAVAAPVIAGCGADAGESESAKTDPNLRGQAHAPATTSSEPTPSESTTGREPPTGREGAEEAAPADDEPPPSELEETPPLQRAPFTPLEGPHGSPSTTTGGDPCFACGMG
jgi:hypothetical protein